MYKALRAVEKVLTRIAEIVLALLFIAIFLMVFYQVVLRYVFNSSIFGTAEVFTMLFGYAGALGSAVMIRYREHIKISVFVDRLPIPWRKAVLTFDYLLISIFSYFILGQSIPWLKSIRTFRSQVTGISRSVESIMIPIAFSLIIFYCVLNVISLFADPKEANQEYATSDTEAQIALKEAEEADKRFLERTQESGEGGAEAER